MRYNWQQTGWPVFQYQLSDLETELLLFYERQGRLSGMLDGLPDDLQRESLIDLMVVEAMKTFAIEGEQLSRPDVLSSIRNNLGLNRTPEAIKDKRSQGVAKLMVAVREQYAVPLSAKLLFDWHSHLMEPYININTGQWRSGKEPMQVISGLFGREEIHFEAPPSDRVKEEMDNYIKWFNATAPGQPLAIIYAPVRSAIAHLYFESIHPFEDGNGRMGRAISEKALSQGTGRPILLSLSMAIEENRNEYYQQLKEAQRKLEITDWISYFLRVITKAQQQAIGQIEFTLQKAKFFARISTEVNPRQEKVLNRMFAAGPDGFKGGISTKKYTSITRASKATATRDLTQLHKLGLLTKMGQGRSTRYQLNLTK